MLETPENEGSEGQKRTKTSILCSKSQKTRVSKAKKAQKWSFCAREEGDWHREERKLVSVSAITCHQYTESRVCCPAILSSICLGGDLGMLRSLNREAKRLFC